MAAECQTNSRQTGLCGDLKLQCALCNSLVDLQLPGEGGLEQRRQHHLDLFICSGPLNVFGEEPG